jgi:hypothetical protein
VSFRHKYSECAIPLYLLGRKGIISEITNITMEIIVYIIIYYSKYKFDYLKSFYIENIKMRDRKQKMTEEYNRMIKSKDEEIEKYKKMSKQYLYSIKLKHYGQVMELSKINTNCVNNHIETNFKYMTKDVKNLDVIDFLLVKQIHGYNITIDKYIDNIEDYYIDHTDDICPHCKERMELTKNNYFKCSKVSKHKDNFYCMFGYKYEYGLQNPIIKTINEKNSLIIRMEEDLDRLEREYQRNKQDFLDNL